MQFKDATIGDTILIHYIDLGSSPTPVLTITFSKTQASLLMPAVVLCQDAIAKHTLLGWNTTTDKVYPSGTKRNIPTNAPPGIDLANLLHNECDCLLPAEYIAGVIPKANLPTEAPCKQCQRPNFLVDRVCWWCAVDNPCR